LDAVKMYHLKYLTVFNVSIQNLFDSQKTGVLFSKKMIRDFYTDGYMLNFIEKDAVFYEGDGDNLFT
jgi:hypothetical protein